VQNAENTVKRPMTEMTSYQLLKETGFNVLTAVVMKSVPSSEA
jgi:hypothetical protein